MTVIKQYTGGNWEPILVGEQGPVGPAGPGVPAGGATGDLLVKNSGTNYDTAWSDAPTVDSITLDTTAAETLAAVGQTVWDDTAGSAATLLKGGNVTAIMGQTIYQRVVNETGSPLTKGQVVYLTGASGQKVTVALAQADGDPTSSKTFGVVAETIAHSQQGFVMTEGLLQGFATNLLTEGAIVWLSPTTAGGMTTTKPTAPDHTVMVGICVKSGSGTSGSILVKVQNGYELDELHDVAYTGTPATGDVLSRSASSLWTNVTRATLAADSAFTSAFAPKTSTVGSSLGTSGTVDLNMATLDGTYQTINLTGGITFTTSNRAAGRSVTVRLVAGGSSRSLAWPSWVFVGSAAPSSLASGKTAVVTVTFFGTADTDGVAAYAAQP